MRTSLKESQVISMVTAVIALYGFFTLPFTSFAISAVFALAIYYLTQSIILVAFVFFLPQVIKIVNTLLGAKEGMTDTNEISNRIKTMTSKYSRGTNLNPETPTKEYFTDAAEVSKRNIQLRNEHMLPKVNEVSGVVDISVPSGTYPIEGTPSYPGFLKEAFMGTNVATNQRIETIPEETLPAVGTVETALRANNTVEGYDDESVNTALVRNMNTQSLAPSNMKSVDMTM